MRPYRVTGKQVAAWARLANKEHREARRGALAAINREAKRTMPKIRIRREHPRAGSRYELELHRLIVAEGLPTPEIQYEFAKDLGRRFRMDFAWPDRMVFAEVDGGRWLVRRGKDGRAVPVGQHVRIEDYRKLNLAAKLGWRGFRFMPEQIRSGEAILELRAVLVRPS